MRITKGIVIDGHIEVEDEIFDEGSSVTILVADENTFTLTDQEETDLLDSMAEADHGNLVDAEDILRRLP